LIGYYPIIHRAVGDAKKSGVEEKLWCKTTGSKGIARKWRLSPRFGLS